MDLSENVPNTVTKPLSVTHSLVLLVSRSPEQPRVSDLLAVTCQELRFMPGFSINLFDILCFLILLKNSVYIYASVCLCEGMVCVSAGIRFSRVGVIGSVGAGNQTQNLWSKLGHANLSCPSYICNDYYSPHWSALTIC